MYFIFYLVKKKKIATEKMQQKKNIILYEKNYLYTHNIIKILNFTPKKFTTT